MAPPPAADGSAPSIDGITSMLDDLQALFGQYEIVITPADTSESGTSNADKLEYLAARDRDFLAVTPELEAAAQEALEEAITALFEEGLPLANSLQSVGDGVLDHLVWRFQHTTDHGPPDVSMNPLRPSTIARKSGVAVRSAVASHAAKLRDTVTNGLSHVSRELAGKALTALSDRNSKAYRKIARRAGNAVIGIDSGDLARGLADATQLTRKV